MDPLKRSNLLWWAISFLTYLAISLFGYFYLVQSFSFYSILVDDQVKDLIVYGSLWTSLIGIYALVAFVMALPLLLPEKLSRWVFRIYLLILGLWTGFLFLGQLADAIMLIVSSPLLFFVRFLNWLLLHSPAVLILLIIIPRFLRKKIVFQSPLQLTMGSGLIFVLLFFVVLFTTFIGYASTVVDGLSGTDPYTARSRDTLPTEAQLTPSERDACNEVRQIIGWGKMWEEMYIESCPDKLAPLQSSKGTIYPIISDGDLKKAMDACSVVNVVFADKGPTGVCLADGTAWVTDNRALLNELYNGLPSEIYQGTVGRCLPPHPLAGDEYDFVDQNLVRQMIEQYCLDKEEPLLL